MRCPVRRDMRTISNLLAHFPLDGRARLIRRLKIQRGNRGAFILAASSDGKNAWFFWKNPRVVRAACNSARVKQPIRFEPRTPPPCARRFLR
jgi:hypothetical protein